MGKSIGGQPARRHSRTKSATVTWIGLGAMLLFGIVYFGVGALAASQLTLPKRVFDPSMNPGAYGLEYQDLRIPARTDHLDIGAWYLPSATNQRAIILVHGRDNSRTNGFVNNFVPFANDLHNAGFAVMMIDLRGHGQSADARYTFGLRERQDVLGAVDWLKARGYAAGEMGVLGYSLGAASVIGAASEEGAIGAVWIDSAYADVAPVIERSWRVESGLPMLFLAPTEWMTRLLYGYDLTASRPVDEIAKISPRPIFLAHCRDDGLIPLSHMVRLAAAVPEAQTWIIDSCDQRSLSADIVPEKYNNHALGYNIQPDEYTRRVISFFQENLK